MMLDETPMAQEGAGASVMSAYVEIVFDNTDKRIDVSCRVAALACPRMCGVRPALLHLPCWPISGYDMLRQPPSPHTRGPACSLRRRGAARGLWRFQLSLALEGFVAGSFAARGICETTGLVLELRTGKCVT